MQITFRLELRFLTKKGQANIIADVCWQGNQYKAWTGEKCFPENFKPNYKTLNFVSPKEPLYFSKNQRLIKIYEFFYQTYRDVVIEKGLPLDKEHLKKLYLQFKKPYISEKEIVTHKKLNELESSSKTIVQAMKEYVLRKADNKPSELTKNNYLRSFKQVYEHLDKFKKNLKLSDISKDLLEGYVKYLFNEDLESNTINVHIKKIKTVLNDIEDLGLLDKSYKDFEHEYIVPEIVYLLPDELERFEKTHLSDEKMSEAKDFYLFGCYMGARYGDLSNFKHTHLIKTKEGTAIRFRPQKNPKKIVQVPLIKKALDIIEKYKNHKNEKILPQISNSDMNVLVKEIAKIAKIDAKIHISEFREKKIIEVEKHKYECITMHTSRHTFATISAMKGVDERTLQALLGHSKLTMTYHYIHIAESLKSHKLKVAWESN